MSDTINNMIRAWTHDAGVSENPKLTDARIAELRGSVAMATCETIGLTVHPEADSDESKAAATEYIAAANRYLSDFAASAGCPNCTRRSSFEYGICYGEGGCRACGYPARAIHDIEGVGKIERLVLFYHPSQLVLTSEPAEISGAS